MRQAVLFLPLLLAVSHAEARLVTIGNSNVRVTVDSESATIVKWTVCNQPCAERGNPLNRVDVATAHAPLAIVGKYGDNTPWQLHSAGDTGLELLQPGPDPAVPAARLRIELEGRYKLVMRLDGVPAATSSQIRFSAPASFQREAGHGFAASHERIVPIAVTRGKLIAGVPVGPEPSEADDPLHETIDDGWVGFRNRFWAFLAQVDSAGQGWRYETAPGTSEGHWESSTSTRLALYAGPIAPSDLRGADPALTRMMFDGLWFWLRWLCFGFLWLLDALHELIRNWGISILALSLVVKILMTPLNAVANRWQRQVNHIQSQLQPTIDAIKREYRGEEQANRILAAHKDLGVTPFYTFKSMAGFLILIPVFLAAFNVLNEAAGLNGARFLWIDDLARPDRFLPLPVVLPFFGDHLNLLPVIMTLITLLSSWHSHDESLSDRLQVTRKRRLYWMAALFFLLFYTFPAGMVMYWTMNTLLQYVADQFLRLRQEARAG